MIYNESKNNSHWEIKNLSQLGSFKRGKSKHRPRNDKLLFVNGKYPLVQTGEISSANLFVRKHSAEYNEKGLKQSNIWPANTLCITIAANIAETAILAYPMCFPDSIVGFNANPEESSEIFMHYVFTYIKKSIQNSASGSIQDNINIDYLTSLKFRIPNKVYQDKIVKILADIDIKIEINDRIKNELESIAKVIYNYWFVQFDFPDESGKPYKSNDGKMVWNEELKREIPEGWEVKSLDEVSNITAGGDKPSIYSEIQTMECSIPIYSNGIDKYGLYGYTNKARIFKQSITVSARGTIGFSILRNNPFVPIIRLIVVTPTIEGYAKFMYEYFQSLNFGKSGSVQQQLTVPQISKLKIIIPPIQLINSFDMVTKSLVSQFEQIGKENKELTGLRDWLLPMLMNGQVVIN